MFGAYRTFLALMVVALHIGGIPIIGAYAVFGFYCLSGYLMTLIMQKNYGYSTHGFKKYALNRFLRLYPLYWISVLFTLVLIGISGNDFTSIYHGSMTLPNSFYDIFTNFAIFFPFRETIRLTPPAWALTVEIFFYIMIGVGLSKNRRVTTLWFVFSFIYHIGVYAFGLGWNHRYFTVFAASLPFSTGAMLFHYKSDITNVIKSSSGKVYSHLPLLLLCLFMLNWLFGYLLDEFKGVFFYSNYALCALMVAVLMNRESLPFINKKFDNWLGEFSYPIYLFHYQIALFVIIILGGFGIELKRPNITLMVISIPFIILLSWFIAVKLERPIEKVRAKIKANKPIKRD
jgi:peptidoglycan/LPS O-acetylase OafA/YrhL